MPSTDRELVVGVARSDDLPAVRALIITGLAQRWDGYLHSANPDLEAFERAYADALVVAAKRAHVIVGCGILTAEAPGVGRIVRMSVAADAQRTGIGGQVLRVLLEHALRLGHTRVVLETTADWHSAVRFYTRHGFTPTEQRDGDQHFSFDLAGHRR